MSLFICRWQNGDFSAVSAASREEAITLPDETGMLNLVNCYRPATSWFIFD